MCFCTLITVVFPGMQKRERKEFLWVCTISHPGVCQTGCVTGFTPLASFSHMNLLCAYLLAKMVPTLSKWPEKRLGSSLILKLHGVMLNRIWHDIFRGFYFLSIFRMPGKTSVIRVVFLYMIFKHMFKFICIYCFYVHLIIFSLIRWWKVHNNNILINSILRSMLWAQQDIQTIKCSTPGHTPSCTRWHWQHCI